MFGKTAAAQAPERGFDWGRAALAAFGAGPQLQQMDARRAQQAALAQRQQEAEREAGQRASLFQNLVKQGMDPGQAELVLANPEAFGTEFNTRFRTRDVSPGATVRTPGLGAAPEQSYTAPTRMEYDGRVTDIPGSDGGPPVQRFDANSGRVNWQTGEWGAFATDRDGRPIRPGTDITSPMGGGQPPQAPANIPTGSPLDQPPPQASQPPTAGQGQSYTDPVYDQLEAQIGPELGVPPELLRAIRTRGERSNANQVSEAGARSVYQFIPETRQAFINQYGVDAWANPHSAVRAAALHLRESYQRTGDWDRAVVEYHGGTDPRQHGPRTRAYAERVGDMGQQTAQASIPNMPGQSRSIQEQAGTGVVAAGQRPPPGYRPTPDGNLAPITGGPGDQTYQRTREARQDVQQLAARFESLPQVQQFNQVRTATDQIRRLAASGSPADDVAIIFSFMRALDPNSTVREGEFATAQNTVGVPDRIRNYYNQARSGTLLAPRQRQEMTQTAYRLYLTRAEQYNEVARRYQGMFRQMGVSEPGVFAPVATGPDTERRNTERRQSPQLPTVRVLRRRVIR